MKDRWWQWAKLWILVLFAMLGYFSTGCDANSFFDKAPFQAAPVEYYLPMGEKLVNLSWQDHTLWVLTRTRMVDDMPDDYEFKESTTGGTLENRVIIHER